MLRQAGDRLYSSFVCNLPFFYQNDANQEQERDVKELSRNRNADETREVIEKVMKQHFSDSAVVMQWKCKSDSTDTQNAEHNRKQEWNDEKVAKWEFE